jgi:hypothetical protein
MFYVPILSSSCKIDELKYNARDKLKLCIDDLEELVDLEMQINSELMRDEKPEHLKLLQMIKAFVLLGV